MMLVFSIIVMCFYLYSVCLVCIAYAIRWTIHRNLKQAWKGRHGLWPPWNIALMKKALWCQWNIPPWFIASMEKAFFLEVMVMVKDKKIQYKYTRSIKISFMPYMKWTRVILSVVFEELKLVWVYFFFFFLFTINANW